MESTSNPRSADLDASLAAVERLLESNPAEAEARASELLAASPGHPMARLFQGIARRLSGDPSGAVDVLKPLCDEARDAPLPHLQLGLALRESGRNEEAVAAIREAVIVRPDFSDAWLALADLLTATGDANAADEAFCEYARLSDRDPRIAEPTAMLRENRIVEAETQLRAHLDRQPTDVRALCLLAEVAVRVGRFDVAAELLSDCLRLAPGYGLARRQYAVVLGRQNRAAEALCEVECLLRDEPSDVSLRKQKATILLHLLEYEAAAQIYEEILREHPDQTQLWASLGHALRSAGQPEGAIRAYRRAIDAPSTAGEAYWNLANLKTFRIGDSELADIRKRLEAPGVRHEERVHLLFALGKALEDRGRFEEAFRRYEEGNRLRRERIRYEPQRMTDHVKYCRDLFTPAFFSERRGCGASAGDPIFVVGLPRSGSTLVEQILASHSAVEGTMELPHVISAATALAERARVEGGRYPDLLASLAADEFARLGNEYLERTSALRKQGTPFFIDKMPNNFLHLGMLHLMFPNAAIIDVRRHPMACGFSLFKHLFAHSQHFSYDLRDIGRYYREYVELMAHFDSVLPGRVHRVVYEALVDDTETEVRRLLDYCGLDFEQSCLDFHRTRRAISTPSSEQVRTPVFRDALDHWRHYERWLGRLGEEVGPLTDSYASRNFATP